MRRFLAILCALIAARGAMSGETSPVRERRAPVWVYLEPVPSLQPAAAQTATPPLEELDALARFVMEGMIYGWKFTYTPQDRARGVTEDFTLDPIREIARGDPRLTLVETRANYPRLECWAVFILDGSDKRWDSYWGSVLFRSASGRGWGEIADGTLGIRKAYAEAIKEAVRAQARADEKNKPKEIRGEALLRDTPRLFADEGRYVADLRLLINIKEIVPYRAF